MESSGLPKRDPKAAIFLQNLQIQRNIIAFEREARRQRGQTDTRLVGAIELIREASKEIDKSSKLGYIALVVSAMSLMASGIGIALSWKSLYSLGV